jgi:hypothetical protein
MHERVCERVNRDVVIPLAVWGMVFTPQRERDPPLLLPLLAFAQQQQSAAAVGDDPNRRVCKSITTLPRSLNTPTTHTHIHIHIEFRMNSDKPKVYGLVIPKKPGQASRARPAPPPKRAPGSAFSLDDEDDDEGEEGQQHQDPMASKQSFNAMLQVRGR